jgi:hypothetical protein
MVNDPTVEWSNQASSLQPAPVAVPKCPGSFALRCFACSAQCVVPWHTWPVIDAGMAVCTPCRQRAVHELGLGFAFGGHGWCCYTVHSNKNKGR